MKPARHLIYIHGFSSSPLSAKAQQIGEALSSNKTSAPFTDVQYHIPLLTYNPDTAIAVLKQTVEPLLPGSVGLIGSSMGGFYGTYIAERYDLPLVLINPAVKPYELLLDHLGENENPYTGEKFTFTEQHVDVFKALEVEPITQPERYLLLTKTGDETLDYQQGVTKYQGCRQIVETGGDHSFSDLDRHLNTIFDFLLN